MIGWIYALDCEELGLVKIGKTANLSKRISQLRIQLPFPVVVRGIIPSPDIDEQESMIHSVFAKQRLNGEWFALSNDDLRGLQSIAAIGFSACPGEMLTEGIRFLEKQARSRQKCGLPTFTAPSEVRKN